MKQKYTLTDIAGTLIVTAMATAILVLFFFFNNGQYIAHVQFG